MSASIKASDMNGRMIVSRWGDAWYVVGGTHPGGKYVWHIGPYPTKDMAREAMSDKSIRSEFATVMEERCKGGWRNEPEGKTPQ